MKKPFPRWQLRQMNSGRLFRNLTTEEISHVLPEHALQGGRVALEFAKGASLSPPSEPVPVNIKALFLGPKAENADLVEQMFLQVLRDHVFWRRNFHPEDLPAIQPEDRIDTAYQTFIAHFQQELFILLGELKADIPFHSPRYIGHMLADISLPALVGYIATLLYNPNNCSWEAAPVTTLIEVEVGRELARMLGFGHTPEELAATWGHITSGGTVANLEAIWVAKALKFLPVAVRFAAADLGLAGLTAGPNRKAIGAMSAWELVNLTPVEALDLKDRFIHTYAQFHPELEPEEAALAAMDRLKAHDILTLGDHAFFARLTGTDAIAAPAMIAPQTLHYSLLKGAGTVGLGVGQVLPIPIDEHFRMDTALLRQALERAYQQRQPVILVAGVAGSTEEGAVDPLHELVSLREKMAERGLGFFLHCDAAYGGYMTACFREPSGKFRRLGEMQEEYGGWPAPEVYKAFAAIGKADAVVVDPHKLGYVPYPAGALVFRDGRCKDLVAQEAAYALGGRVRHPGEISLGRYILEGSKPGAAAAAVFLSHRVVPLDRHGYGKLLGHTLRIARIFHKRLLTFANTVQDEFIVTPLVLPDTNILDYCFNLAGNDRLDVMNRFAQALYRELSIDPQNPVQTRHFIVSHTEFGYANYHPGVIKPFLEGRLGIRREYFASPEELWQRRKQG